ncbi:hypothetical protein ABW20_dc0103941 [Dactylellina cionopaga]|nr:hypothetical protein ABW20_dc0103941 [Dactylellina cionopaga]
MARTHSRRLRKAKSSRKRARKLAQRELASKSPGKPSKDSTKKECPNFILLGFQQNKPFKDVYKDFVRHGITNHDKILNKMQDQWGSCPSYTDPLRKYWWNLQIEQKEHFAMLKRESRAARKAKTKGQTNIIKVTPPIIANEMPTGSLKKELLVESPNNIQPKLPEDWKNALQLQFGQIKPTTSQKSYTSNLNNKSSKRSDIALRKGGIHLRET